MPRRGRIRRLADNGVYHVLNRGNGRMKIFAKAGNFAAFVKLLEEGRRRTGMRVRLPVFNWMKRRRPAVTASMELIASQPPGEIFPWPKGAVLTAIDELVLALPIAMLGTDRPMAEAVFGPDDMEMNIPPGSETFFIRLRSGMSVSLANSVQSFIVADDRQPHDQGHATAA